MTHEKLKKLPSKTTNRFSIFPLLPLAPQLNLCSKMWLINQLYLELGSAVYLASNIAALQPFVMFSATKANLLGFLPGGHRLVWKYNEGYRVWSNTYPTALEYLLPQCDLMGREWRLLRATIAHVTSILSEKTDKIPLSILGLWLILWCNTYYVRVPKIEDHFCII